MKLLSGIKQYRSFIIIVSLTVISLIFSGYFLYTYLDKTIAAFKKDVVVSFENSLDKIITYESISPSVFQYLEIRKFFVTDSNGECLIKIDNFKISFSLYKYFFTDKFPISSIYLENSSFSYDNKRDNTSLEQIINRISLNSSSGKKKRKLEELTIRGKNISISSNLPGGSYNLSKLFIDTDFSDDKILFNLRTRASGDNIVFNKKTNKLTSDINISGEFGRKSNWHNFDIEFLNMSADDYFIKKLNLNINHSENIVKIIKTKARDPFDFYAEYNIETRLLSINSKVENYRPADYLKYYKNDRLILPMLKSAYSGSAEIIYSFHNDIGSLISYSADLSIIADKSLIPFKNSLKTVFHGNSDKIDITELNVKTGKGNLLYRGNIDLKNLLPEGNLHISSVGLSDSIDIDSSITLSAAGPRGDQLFLVSDTKIGKLKLDKIECLVKKEKNGISYNLSYIGNKQGFIKNEGNFEFRPKNNFYSSDLEIKNISLYSISEAFAEDKGPNKYIFSDNVFFNTKLNFETDFKRLDLFSSDLSITDNSNNKISSEISMSTGNLTFYNILVNWNKYHGKGNTNIYRENNNYSIKSYLSLNNELYNFEGDFFPGNSITVTGNNNFNFAMFFDKSRTVFNLFTEKFPIPLYSSSFSATLNIKGETGRNGWNVMLINNKLHNLPFLKGEDNFISFSSRITNQDIKIQKFSLKDRFSTVDGLGEILIREQNSINGWIRGSGIGSTESHLLMFNHKKGESEITAEFRDLPAERITRQPVSGKATGVFYFKGSRSNPNYSLDISMDDGKFLEDPFSFNLSLNASNDSLLLNSLNMKYNHNRIDSASGFINRNEGNYLFNGSLILKKGIESKGIRNDIELKGEIFNTDFKWFTNPLLIENKGILKAGNPESSNPEFREWNLSFINNESFLVFNGGPASSIEGEISRSGIFNVILSKPLPLSGTFSGEIKEGIINSEINNMELDLHTFGNLTNIAYFKANSGTAMGSLSVTGPVNDPDFKGHLIVSAVKATSSFIPEEIILPNTSFIFNGKALSMPETEISVAENTARVKVLFQLDHWLPRDFNLNITTNPGEMLWIKHRFAMIDVDGFGSGNLIIDGDEQGLKISGALIIKKCIITLSEEEKGAEAKKKGSFDYEVDLKITSGPGVEFFWPSVRLPVLRTFAAAGGVLTFYSDSATDKYSLAGDIKIQGGEVFYFSQSFFVKEGSISFNENETKFDPHLTARAELRERTSDNREVKISLIADDTPLSRFSPRFESSPPLSENEIYSLLGESVYSQFGGDNITFGSALIGAGTYSTQLIGILRPFEAQMKKILNLDLFSIRTNFLQQAFGNDTTTELTPVNDNEPVNNTYLDNTTIFMGKYYGEYFFLEGLVSFNSRDFDIYEYNDYDVPDFMGMQIKTELSLEVDTPLFLMDLTLYPQTNNFYNSLMDTSLEFSWRFSY